MSLNWPTNPPVLRAENIVLRPWRDSDAEAVFDACQDPDIQHWTTVPSPYRRHHATGFIAEYAPSNWQSQEGTPFCIADAGDDSVLGACDLFKFDGGNLVAEVGYWVAPWARGRGVATEAITTLARWAIAELGLGRLEFLILPDNTASRAVAARCGAAFEGLLRRKVVIDGEGRDMVLYALIAA